MMRKTQLVSIVLLLTLASARAQDQFAGITCGSDIPKALIGKRDSNGPVAAVESRHKDLGLKNLGGDEISDRLFLASWKICGSEYELLLNTQGGIIRDVLPFPPHSKTSPMFIGACQVDGKAAPGSVVAVLNSNGAQPHGKSMLKASSAWKIDEATEKFVKIPTQNLECPVDGIVSEDGGK